MRVNWKLTLWLLSPLVLGAVLLATKNQRDLSLVPLQSGVLPRKYKIANSTTALTFSPDSRTLAIGDTHNQLHLWDVSARKFSKRYSADYSFKSLQWKANSLTGTEFNSCRIYGAKTGKIELEFPSRSQSQIPRFKMQLYNQVVASPDASTVVFGQTDGRISAWNARTGTLRYQFTPPNRETCGLALSGDAKMLAVGELILEGDKPKTYRTVSIGTEITLRDASSGKLLKTLSWNEAGIERNTLYDNSLGHLGLSFSPDGTKLVGAAPYGIRIWDIKTGRALFTSAPDERLRFKGEKTVIFSPDGALIAAYWGKAIAVWSVQTNELARVFINKHGNHALAFAPNSKLLASDAQDGNGDAVFQIWDVSDLR